MTREFGTLNGKTVNAITIKNEFIEAEILSYGATLRSLKVKDKNGNPVDVCLGYDTLEEYVNSNGYFGATVGRVANRIGDARFTLDGEEYTLAQNNGKNTLHGGKIGFDKAIWHYSGSEDETSVMLFLTSPDGDEGFPGNLYVEVTYTVNGNSLEISYKATTDKRTPVNLTNHSYFNLGGHASGDIYAHTLKLNAHLFTEVDDGLIPTGRLASVESTALDFTKETLLGDRLNCEELSSTKGVDHNFALDKGWDIAASLYCEKTGIQMDTVTTLEGVQIYTAGGLGDRNGKDGAKYSRHNGICLETQHFPDSINKPEFPSCVLDAGKTWAHTTAYKFSVR
ncbi:MAG: galactose mutarotase [Clostridia bacterium]|nr:galactose mutarotase [Clostridia bacterium]